MRGLEGEKKRKKKAQKKNPGGNQTATSKRPPGGATVRTLCEDAGRGGLLFCLFFLFRWKIKVKRLISGAGGARGGLYGSPLGGRRR